MEAASATTAVYTRRRRTLLCYFFWKGNEGCSNVGGMKFWPGFCCHIKEKVEIWGLDTGVVQGSLDGDAGQREV